jgi:bifunctional oligoribonuclease and PAP phosphatase NrnA
MQKLEELKELLFKNTLKILITTHHNPDADAMGSSLALQKKGHEVQVIVPSIYPNFLNWLPNIKEVVVFDEKATPKSEELIEAADLICMLDFSAYQRLHGLAPIIQKSKSKTLLLDHHLEPDVVSDYELWNPHAAATAELVFDLIEMLGDKELIDSKIGSCIYAGIIADTGSFKFPSTSAHVHRITAELLDLGVNTNMIHRFIYDNGTEKRLRFLGFALKDKLSVLPDLHTAYFAFDIHELERYSNQTGDTEGVVNYALSLKGIIFAAIFIQKPDGGVKMSFRSVGDFAVNEFASKHFEGGGHKNAAGGISHDLNLEKSVLKFMSLLSEYKNQLKTTYQKTLSF